MIIAGVFLLYSYAMRDGDGTIAQNSLLYKIILLMWAALNALGDLSRARWLGQMHRRGWIDSSGVSAVYGGTGILSLVFAVILVLRGSDNAVSLLFLLALYALFFGVLRMIGTVMGLRNIQAVLE